MNHLKLAEIWNISLSKRQIAQFEQYYQLLADWNQRMNLTNIIDYEAVQIKHFLDSLSCIQGFAESPQNLIDIGTGAGFPGLPLKIFWPEMPLTLVDSVGKKCKFLQAVVDELELEQVTIIHARAEDLGQDLAHREQYWAAVARAVARMAVLSEYLLPLVRVGGQVVVQKGVNPREELLQAKTALKILGGKPEITLPVTVPDLAAERHVIRLRKTTPTPKAYPRRAGLPSKQAL